MPDVGPSTPAYVIGDALEKLRQLPDGWAHCCVTSPPYWSLRDYGVAGQLGLEKAPDEYVANLVAVFREVRRVLRDDGTLWLNLGDSYASSGGYARGGKDGGLLGSRPASAGTRSRARVTGAAGIKPKNLVGIPWRVALALQADGWYLRSDIIWAKTNPMPESVTDRPTRAHEYVFLLTKSARYHYDAEAIREVGSQDSHGGGVVGDHRYTARSGRDDTAVGLGVSAGASGRNRRTVWTISTRPYPKAHFAVMPSALAELCILAGCPPGGIVLDPFMGAGTTGMVAQDLGRTWYGIELNPEYAALIEERTAESKK
ncbi:hypothetical protein LCGC14_0460370 [marine sediment metagenome]|uniref:site-specific DNA-methyltransferase (cytosine-N(4)-specific) n=1 Tax=marine sediment metagenome TaxID=412755 RepID=A0A0F9SY38_9ZZZZ